ncbi:hypothetical protein [Streptomyces phaeochromogenes]|uniref:hypothetical protein n=1 Tax=Streptomyces phaeochromogenes TaxID=1923 RepID=UPI0038632BAE|nr:TniQ family protein [Streptomyces phaeochromogenes]
MTDHLSSPLAPLPVNVRPRLGETTDHYIQRLARANHLRPSDLLQHLTPPPHKTGRRPQLNRLAALSGRSTDVLANTLTNAGPTAEPTPSILRLQHHSALNDTGHNVTSLIKHNARRSNNSLKQIADTWKIPLWLLRRVLDPRFPDPKPPLRASMSEDTYRTIWEHYMQGATPTQTWHNLLDDHVDWIPLTTVTKLFLRFSEENGTAELDDANDPRY